eukprot:TRINITY_DN5716_c0_g1_i5.p1 TRINITY_DN5716_c0_g1~~TRINITY_DN5716_c0_g1_i5.p1  ORF type:complete len:859 (+),score=112.28 TRINITY_DN5716_c0_g1_i5:76-2652(+)
MPNVLSLFLLCLIPLVASDEGDCYVSPVADTFPISPNYSCPLGWHCPNITEGVPRTLPSFCPPTAECQLIRLAGKYCESQGPYEPVLCAAGYYCPTFRERYICPEGHFCPKGSSYPRFCPAMSICKRGAVQRVYYGPLVICLIIDVVMTIAYVVLNRHALLHTFRRWIMCLPDSVDTQDLQEAEEPQEPQSEASNGPVHLELCHTSFKAPLPSPPIETTYSRAVQRLTDNFIRANKVSSGDAFFLNIAFEGLKVILPPPINKTILAGITGEVCAGKLTAVMGPSGCGKTTFLNCLMGKVDRTHGELLINGHPDEVREFRKCIGFVPQEDVMLRELSVRENIAHAARIRLPQWTSDDIEQHIDAVLDTLGLTEVRDTLIGDENERGVSGGQRRRVNIGMELAAAPLAIFLDEPTSGLDSTAALEVCGALKRIAQLGITVVAVIHQPRLEIFESFDELIMLAPGGKTVYIGPRAHVMRYFMNLGFEFDPHQNIADELMDMISGRKLSGSGSVDLPSAWVNRQPSFDPPLPSARVVSMPQESKDDTVRINVPVRQAFQEPLRAGNTLRLNQQRFLSERGASLLAQVVFCHNRSVLQQYRKSEAYVLEIAVAVLAGALMGAAVMGLKGALYQGVFLDNFILLSPSPVESIVPQLGLYVGMAVGLAGAPAGVKTFGEERSMYWREVSAGHSSLAYYIAKTIAVMYRLTSVSFHFSAVFYLLASPIAEYWQIFLIIWMEFFGVYGLAAVISMLVKRENAALLAVVITLFAGVFCGYGPSLKDSRQMGYDFLMEASYARWGSEALYHLETAPFTHIFRVHEVSAPIFGYTLDRFGFDIGMMCLIGMIYRLVAYLLLIGLNRDKQR